MVMVHILSRGLQGAMAIDEPWAIGQARYQMEKFGHHWYCKWRCAF